ncbi:hypothetical protein GCM10022403_017950 [Streptomyces coacervatus]|uniref:Uncharacterized protein n=1 Tax=Streptomyces coacervatus TaxID=647381 RepID=A0ABP7H402_9ACTN|nr:hypothetical protein [Streptomyces coacervatus]MDF2271581.1 hypothetical protein [Streptomyces coacervatus]
MDEVKVEQDLVRALLRDRHLDLADLELRDVSEPFPTSRVSWEVGMTDR